MREYNKGFNYFSEMKDDEITEEMRKSNTAGGRPTWTQSTNGSTGRAKPSRTTSKTRDYSNGNIHDPLNLFARASRSRGQRPMTEREMRLVEADKRALEVLGFSGRVPPEDIKRAYKEQVKIHHPDANGGDRASEDRLRAIITAYNHLKSKGFVAR